MTAEDAVEILSALEDAGIRVWADGWAVDAAIGTQTRAHDDLDLVLAMDNLERLRDVLEAPEQHRRPRASGPSAEH